MLTIHQRPFPPQDRSQPGHWEGDLIIGKDQRSAIGTLVERQTRMVRLLHLPQRDGDTLHDALKVRMADLPAALLRSITWDQGTEMARHLTIARSLGAPVYFCDSRSPWQRGSNENTNGLLRDYFPKGHRPEHPLGAAPPSRRERAQQPAQTHPQRPRAGRAVRDAASLHNRPRCDID
jgi:transposase, IS30 family